MNNVGAYLDRLRRFGTLVEIEWGEDDNLWFVTWITGGYRLMASDTDLEKALGDVWLKAAVERAGEKDGT